MASHFPVKELYDEVVAWFAAKSDPAEHVFGSKGLAERRNTNSYVWFWRSSRRIDNESTRGIDKHKINFGAEHVFHIHCWGEDEEKAYLMAENVQFAIRELGRADVSFLGADVVDFEEQGHNELGCTYVLEMALRAAFVRRYTPIATYAGSSQTVTPPDVPTTVIQSVTVEVHATNDINSDGVVMGSDSVNDEFSEEFSEEFQL